MNIPREQVNRLAQFTLEMACDAVVWHGKDARFMHANPSACRLFGYQLEEMLNLSVQDVSPESTAESFQNIWERVKASGTFHTEDELRTKGGKLIPVDVMINYISFEGQEFVCSFIRDISKRKQLEKERECAFNEIKRLREQLELENEYLQETVETLNSFGSMVGSSPALETIARQIEMVAPTDACVLITGESGTGKELIAHEIHKHSPRHARTLIRVNCASIPRDLYESEFFGHVKGAFTGAVKDRAGRFELADGGTLFLDEIGEIPLDLQSKLLRVLQEGTFERLGDESTRKVDVRIITATNRDLKQEMEAGRFREDLFYRLNVFPIEVPPLRKRKEDIPQLAQHFLKHFTEKFNKPLPKLLKGDIARLKKYDWPGNIRELQNALERAVITSPAKKLHFDVPVKNPALLEAREAMTSTMEKGEIPETIYTLKEMKQREKENLLAALKHTGGKIFGPGGAARLLDAPPTTLTSKIRSMGLKKSWSKGD